MISFQVAKKMQKEHDLNLKKNPKKMVNETPDFSEEVKEAIRNQVGAGARKPQNEEEAKVPLPPAPVRRTGRFAPSQNSNLCKNC